MLSSRVTCPNHGTAGTKSLIGAQSGVSLRMMAFYLGNVGLKSKNIRGLTREQDFTIHDGKTLLTRTDPEQR